MSPRRFHPRLLALSLPLGSLLVPALAHAQSTWVGTTSTDWANAANWVPGLPEAGGNITIHDATTNGLTLDAAHTIGSLTFGTAGTRTANFTLQTQAANQLTLDDGIIANGAFATTALTLRGHYIVSDDQVWTIGGDSSGNDDGIFLREVATGAENRGSLTLNGDLTKDGNGKLVLAAVDVLGTGNLIADAGYLKMNAGASQPLVVGGTGNITLNGNSTLGVFKNSGTMNITRDIVMNDSSTLLTRAGGNDVASAIEFNGSHTMDIGSTTNLSGDWTGSGTLARVGGGTLNLSGDLTGFTGTLLTAGGITSLPGPFGGSLEITVGGTITGEGAIAGDLEISGGTLIGEWTAGGDVTLDGGSFSADPLTATSLHAAGNLALLSQTSITLSQLPVASTPFAVLTYGGSFSGDVANLAMIGGNENYRALTFDTSTSGSVMMEVDWENRTWAGGTAWDVNTSSNWAEGDQRFLQMDAVTFGDNGAGFVDIVGILSPSSITIDSSADYTFLAEPGNSIVGPAGITKSGSGIATLAGINSFNGGIHITGGTLRGSGTSQVFGANGQLITIEEGATLDFNGAMTAGRDHQAVIIGTGVDGAGAIINTGAENQQGLRSLTLSGDASIGGFARWDIRPSLAGTAFIDLGGFTLTKTETNKIAFVEGVINEPGDIVIENGTLAFTRSEISGDGTIRVDEGATMQLENYSTGSFSKPIELNDSILLSTGNSFNLESQITLGGDAWIAVGANTTLTASTPVIGSGNLEKRDAGILEFTAANTYTGSTTIDSGSIQLGTGGSINSGPVNLATTAAALIFNSTEDVTFPNAIIGSGVTGNDSNPAALTKLGPNTLTLTGASTYTGTTRLGGGMVAIGADEPVFGTGLIDLRSGGIQSSDATARTLANDISLSANTPLGTADTGNLLFTGAVAAGGASKRLTINNAVTEFSGPIAGTGAGTTITKAGPGTLIFSGDNTYTQTTTISEGVMQVGDGGSAGSLAGSEVINNASLVIHRSLPEGETEMLFPNLITGSGSLTHSGPAFTILGADNTYSGDTIVTAGTLSPTFPSLSDSGSVRLSGSGNLELFHEETDAVDSLFIDGEPQQPGLWGRVGSVAELGADFESPRILGDGLLSVTSEGGTATSFESWASARGLAPGNDGPDDNPDADRWNNLAEFALDGDPLSGADSGKVVVATAPVAGVPTLTLTLPVRESVGAFEGAAALSASGDDVTYHIEGSIDLETWTRDIDEVTGADATAIQAGLPELSDGWVYRTFRSSSPISGSPQEFLRARIE